MHIARARLLFDAVILAVFAAALWRSQSFNTLAQMYPETVCMIGLVAAGLTLGVDSYRYARGHDVLRSPLMELEALLGEGQDEGIGRPMMAQIVRCWLWMIALPIGMYINGVIVGTFLFISIFLSIEAGVRLKWAVLSAAAWTGLLAIVAEAVNMRWPESLLHIPGL